MSWSLFLSLFALYAGLCIGLWQIGSAPVYRAEQMGEPDEGSLMHTNPTA